MNKPTVVQKYGGSSVASLDKLRQVARLICARKRAGSHVVAVVSAMGDTTDDLLDKARALSTRPDPRELDMLLSAGERIAMSLLALAIREEGLEAISLTGSQSGIITTAHHSQARIIEVRPFRVQDELERDRIVIVAGFQGMSYARDVTTLGRGGSDTTAVALAAALDAECCEIYSDVEGVFTTDPRVVPQARVLPAVGYAEMQELAEAGARVLNADAVEFAKRRGIAIYARRTGSDHLGTVIRKDVPRAPSGIRGIAFETRVGLVSARVTSASSIPRFLEEVRRAGGRPKQLQYGGHPEAFFGSVVGLEGAVREASIESIASSSFGAGSYQGGVGTVSLLGDGITADDGPLLQALATLDRADIAIVAMSTSSFRISFVVRDHFVTQATALLHESLGLERPHVEARL